VGGDGGGRRLPFEGIVNQFKRATLSGIERGVLTGKGIESEGEEERERRRSSNQRGKMENL